MISRGHHHDFNSFSGVAREVVVLRMLHLFLRFMSQKHQSFSHSLSHASLECPPRCGSLDHVADAVNMISCRPLIDDHTHTPKVRVPTKQPWDTNEKWRLAIPQRQEQCPQSPRDVASMLTIAMGFCRHDIPTQWCANVLHRCQLHPCHLEKRKKMRVNNH
jgi:hypothetical protein